MSLQRRNSIHHSLLQRPFCEHPPAPAAAAEAARSPTTLSHIVFVIGASKTTWAKRGEYTGLWWRPGAMRGHVWLDGEPSGPWHPSWPPYRVLRPNAARFGREHAAAARMAQAVAEAYHATAAAAAGLEEGAGTPGSGEARWLVMGDDDTVFFPENLAAVLDMYDHRELYYVGSSSESVGQNVAHSYAMAFGGGGYAISFPAAAALAGIMDGCLDRYNELYGSDHRVQSCLAELGVRLAREPCFHQSGLCFYGILDQRVLTAEVVEKRYRRYNTCSFRLAFPVGRSRTHSEMEPIWMNPKSEREPIIKINRCRTGADHWFVHSHFYWLRCFRTTLQLDLKGHVYGLLAAHPVAPLVSLHHLDRLRPISPNSLKRLHAVRSLVGASRRDPARTLQQSICYYRPRSRGAAVTLSVSVSWGYMVHLYPSAVPPHELQTPLRTFRAWSGSPAGPFTVNTRPEAAPNATVLPCHRRPIMFYLDRVTTEESAG
ncbi:uncharacterized protein [Miscanthus floridulus]|uniref:uncharacterized protein n=1 Tax=Miscanthus floridulus TaxID=154761 RepID=UPI0034596449